MPILANVYIAAENNELLLKATDLEVGIITKCPAQVVEPGELTVNAKQLQDMLNTFSGNQVTFSLSEGSMLDLVCDSARFSIETMSTLDFPSIPECDFEDALKLPNSFFNFCISRVLFSVSTDPHKYALNGALMQIQDNEMNMVSTDGENSPSFPMRPLRSRRSRLSRTDKPSDGKIRAVNLHHLYYGFPLVRILATCLLVDHRHQGNEELRLVWGDFADCIVSGNDVRECDENRRQVALLNLQAASFVMDYLACAVESKYALEKDSEVSVRCWAIMAEREATCRERPSEIIKAFADSIEYGKSDGQYRLDFSGTVEEIITQYIIPGSGLSGSSSLKKQPTRN